MGAAKGARKEGRGGTENLHGLQEVPVRVALAEVLLAVTVL